MLITSSPYKKDVAIFLILAACFFSFVYNYIPLSKDNFYLGQLSFYFIALLPFVGYFELSPRTLKTYVAFTLYLLIAAGILFLFYDQLRSSKLFINSLIKLTLIFYIVEQAAFIEERSSNFHEKVSNFFVMSIWPVIFCLLYFIYHHSQADFDPNQFGRFKGFTQEPSYLAVYICTVLPFVLFNINNNKNFYRNIFLAFFLFLAIFFSFSKTGIIAGSMIFTLCIKKPYKFFILSFFALFFIPSPFLSSQIGIISQWQHQHFDSSMLIRFGSMISALLTFKSNFWLGTGFGNSGFYLSEYYPPWFWISEEASYWSSLSLVGMSPSFTFLFKILPEIGFFGILLFTVYSYPVFNQYKNLSCKESIKPFAFSIVGFLIASFGVEGFLYFPFWIIVGVFVGYLRKFNS